MNRNTITRIIALCLTVCLLLSGYTVSLAEGVTITQQPQNAYAAEGEQATLTVAAEGEGLTYQWYVAKAGASSFSKSSVTGTKYSIIMSADNNGRQAYCVVTDSSGASVQSSTATLNIKQTVKITSQPVNASAALDEKISVSVGATGDGLSYQWYFADNGSSTFSKASITSKTYSTTMTAARAGRQVYCVVKDQYGNTEQSSTVTLSLKQTVKITAQPANASAYAGEKATIKVEATGDGLTYQWYVAKAGATSFSASSVKAASYTVTLSEASNGRQAYCVVTDQYGNSEQSDTVVFTMKNKATITVQPVNVKVKEGKVAKTTVQATGDGLTYQWYFAAAGSTKFSKASITTATYSVTMDSTRAGRQVYCVVTDQYGNTAQSDTVTLDMATTLSIDEQPIGTASGSQSTVSASVTATGDGLTYQWYVASGASSTFELSAETSATYTMSAEDGAAIRKVYCVVTDQYGDSLQSETVTLCAAYKGYCYDFTGAEIKLTGYTGSATQLSIPSTIGGYAVVSIQSGAFQDLKEITSVQIAEDGKLEEIGANAFSGCEKLASVNLPASIKTIGSGAFAGCTALKASVYKASYARTWCAENGVAVNVIDAIVAAITAQPQNVTVQNGEKATVSFTAQGDGLTYTWYFKDASASKFSKTTSFTGNTYTVTMTAARADRQVYCVVTDEYGNTATTDTVTLGMKTKLEITAQPVSVKAAPGETATVKFTAKGDDLTYQWYFKNATASKFTLTTAFKSATYAVAMDASRHNRQLYCVVTDKYGDSVTTDTVTISLLTSLKITAQPESVTVDEGAKASVTFTAEGEGLTYTWYFKDAAATKFSKTTSFTSNSYTTVMTAARAGRQIYCIVTDQYGNTAQTDTVTLGMRTKLEITAQTVDAQAAPGETATVKFTAKGDGLTYQWYFKNATASKFSLTTAFKGATYAVAMDASRHNRQLYCVVTDKYGNSVTTDTVTIRLLTSLKITAQPEDVLVDEGAKATVTFTAEGEGLTYTWYFKDATATKFSKTTSFTSNTYSTVLTTARAGRQIYCIVTDQYGNTAQTNTVTLGMRTKLEIVSQPVDVVVAEGETAAATVEAKGDGLTYTWYLKTATGTKFYKSSVTTPTYGYVMDESKAGRSVYCIVTDQYGNTMQSETATLYMLPKDYTITVQNGEVTITGYTGSATELAVPAELCGMPVTAIGEKCFENNTALTSVTLPASVKAIGDYAFSGCTGLTAMDIPSAVTVISEGMFSNCSGLTKVTMSNNVTLIEYRAFYYCTSLSQMETK